MSNEYLVNSDDLTGVADAIREKGGTNEQLVFPSGFVTAIEGISAGAGLNFEIVGGTKQPDSPKENTIWINTSTAITGWAFSAEQPESPAAGMVWIAVSASSTVAFNALKENTLQVYPIGAQQYVGGAWIYKDALVRQSGQWNAFRYYLFKSGNGEIVPLSIYKEGNADFSMDNSAISITYNYTQGDYCVALRTSGKIDFSKYSTLCMTATPSKLLNANYAWLGVTSSAFTSANWDNPPVTLSKKVKIPESSSEKTIKLDVSGVKSELYVALIFGGRMDIADIWLE